MKRSLAGVVAIAVMLIGTQALAESSEYLSYLDTFETGGYAGSHGSIPWESTWKEIGESDGPDAGVWQVHHEEGCADGACAHAVSAGEKYEAIGIVRAADLSMFQYVELCYDITRDFEDDGKGLADARLLVQVTSDGETWSTIKDLELQASDGGPLHKSHDISKWISKSFAVRYLVTGTLTGAVYVDNVEIQGTIPPATTTTTSTTTTTTRPKPTTTTTVRPTTTSTVPETTTTSSTTSTTLPLATTTTSPDDDEGFVGATPTDGPPPGTGLREADMGIQADYDATIFGNMEMDEPQVLGFEVAAEYRLAAEAIEASWMWMLSLGVIVAWAIVSNMDRRRFDA